MVPVPSPVRAPVAWLHEPEVDAPDVGYCSTLHCPRGADSLSGSLDCSLCIRAVFAARNMVNNYHQGYHPNSLLTVHYSVSTFLTPSLPMVFRRNGWGWMTHRNVSILEICVAKCFFSSPLAGSPLVEDLDLVSFPWKYSTPPWIAFSETSRQTRGGAVRLHQNENAGVCAMRASRLYP